MHHTWCTPIYLYTHIYVGSMQVVIARMCRNVCWHRESGHTHRVCMTYIYIYIHIQCITQCITTLDRHCVPMTHWEKECMLRQREWERESGHTHWGCMTHRDCVAMYWYVILCTWYTCTWIHLYIYIYIYNVSHMTPSMCDTHICTRVCATHIHVQCITQCIMDHTCHTHWYTHTYMIHTQCVWHTERHNVSRYISLTHTHTQTQCILAYCMS